MKKLIFKVGLLCVVLFGLTGTSLAQSFSVQRIGNGKRRTRTRVGLETWAQSESRKGFCRAGQRGNGAGRGKRSDQRERFSRFNSIR